MSDVFVSYSRRDADEAEQLCAVLEGAGISCWIAPRDIPPGQAWPASIAAAIASARLVAVLVSDASNASAEVAREVIAALDARVPLVPIRLHDVVPAGNLAYLLAGLQWHDAFHAARFAPNDAIAVVRAVLDGSRPAERLAPRAPAAHVVPGNLPAVTTALLGREADLARLDALFDTHRLITLTGAGGVGKTRLALAAIASATGRWTDGRYFDDLAPLTDPARLSETIASVLGLGELAAESVQIAIERALQDGPRVIVLDNCEHVIAEAARCAQALVRSTPVTIVTTSREPLRVEGEVVYRVPSLDLDAAVALFADRATAAVQTFQLTPVNRPIVEGIARAVDGIPFAIELAAARIRAMTPAEIATRLSARFRLLTGGNRTSLPRQQTLHATIDWSHELLGETERRVFRRLAVFAGGWTLDAAGAVCADDDLDAWDVADLVASLVDKSLVVHAADGDARYRFLESTRAYALERLAAAGEGDALALRHLAWFTTFAEAGQRDWTSLAREVWTTTYTADIENQRLALATAIGERKDVVRGLRLAAELRALWIATGRPAEGVAWCERALDAAGDDGSPAIAWALLAICRLLEYGIHVQRRLAAATRAIDIFRAHGEERGLIQALEDAAFALRESGARAQADERSGEALALARRLGDTQLISHCLLTRSFTIDVSRVDERRALLEEAYAIATRANNEPERASFLLWLAELEADAGDRAAARRRGADALAVFVKIGDRMEAAFCSANLCAYALDDGDHGMAEAYLTDALRFADGNVPLVSAIATQYTGEIALLRGDLEGAARAKGFSDARMAALDIVRGATEERSFQRLDTALRAGLDALAFERLVAEGRSLDEAAILSWASPSTDRLSNDRTASGSL